ncbi:Uncharacterised protein [Enterobacter hormaechei]|nr:Uncharacterised protein [Enterobacter hormaechei]
MKLTRVHRHAGLFITDIFQAQIAPAAYYLADFQPWHPAVRGVKQQMQARGGAHQKRHRTEQ